MRTRLAARPDPSTIQSGSDRRASIRALRSELRAFSDEQIECKHSAALSGGCSGHALSLACGTHEWFGSDHVAGITYPPLALLIDMAARSVCEPAQPGCAVWIGRACWPYPHALCQRAASGSIRTELLDRSIFVDPPDRATRVWSIDLALRSTGSTLVIADGSGLSMAESRRLQLAASSSGSAGLFARPEHARAALSAASTRWMVEPASENAQDHGGDRIDRKLATRDQAWTVHLLRCKGLQPTSRSARHWTVRRDHATGALDEWAPNHGRLAAAMDDRSAFPPESTRQQAQRGA